MYIDKLNHIVNEYKNIYHRTIKLLMILMVKTILEHSMKKNCKR